MSKAWNSPWDFDSWGYVPLMFSSSLLSSFGLRPHPYFPEDHYKDAISTAQCDLDYEGRMTVFLAWGQCLFGNYKTEVNITINEN